MTAPGPDDTPPTFIGPDGGEYRYVHPDEVPSYDHVDSRLIAPPEGAPEETPEVTGESTPEEV